MVLNSDTENLSEGDAIWLPGAVTNRLESNLGSYTDFILVDSSNERRIKQLQKKSETSSFDNETAIEIGKLTSAQYAVFSVIRRTGSTYSLNCDLTNLTTGEKKVFLVSGKKSLDEIFNTAGCAADEIVLKLCENSGLPLTASQRYTLMHGDSDDSYRETLKQIQEEVDAFNEMMASLDSRIRSLSTSTELSASAKLAKMEAEKAITQEKLKSAQQRKEKFMEEERKKTEDAVADQERSLEQKRKRDQMAKRLAEKASAVRKNVLETSTIISQINTIEAKKSALVEIRRNVETQVRESDEILEAEMDSKILEIENQPYRKAELDKGKPTELAVRNRMEKINALRSDYDSKRRDEEKNIRNSTAVQEQNLYREIRNDYRLISRPRTATSLGNEIKYTIGEYSGVSMSWQISVYFYSNNIPLFSKEIELKYSDITGQKSISRKDYENYLDTVDLYESLFRRGDPLLAFEMDFKVEALSDEYPSQYRFDMIALRVKDTLNGKVYLSEKLEKVSFVREFSPAYDIRKKNDQMKIPGKSVEVENERMKQEAQKKIDRRLAEEEKRRNEILAEKERREAERLARDYERELKREEARERLEEAREERRERREEARERREEAREERREMREDRLEDARYMVSGRGGLCIGDDGMTGFNFLGTINVTKFAFVGLSVGSIKRPDSMKFMDSEQLVDITAVTGLNWRFPFLCWTPNIYGMCGFGCAFGKTIEKWKGPDSSSSSKKSSSGSSSSSSSSSKDNVDLEFANYGFIRPSIGVEIPLFRYLSLYGQGNFNIILESETSFDVEIGLAITL